MKETDDRNKSDMETLVSEASAPDRKKRKQVFRFFRYIECDAFAEYLHDMSQQGWHFTEWRMQLVFEKGEPADITYCVNVFTKGSEMDERLREDAEEFAEYCAAAGWKLIDGKKRYCIFRKEREDAVPIVTEEERFRNVCRAETWQLLWSALGVALIAGLDWFQMLGRDFVRWIFSPVNLFVLADMTALLVLRVFQFLAFAVWALRMRRYVREGGSIRYGRTKSRFVWYALLVFTFAGLAYAATQGDAYIVGMACLLAVGILVVVGGLQGHLRPLRGGNWAVTIGCVVVLVPLVMVLSLVGGSGNYANPADDMLRLPLTQNDYKQVDGEVFYTNYERSETIFGSRLYGVVDYGDPEEEEPEDWLSYTVYRSDFPWVLEKTWETEASDGRTKASAEVAARWGAEEARTDLLIPETLYLRYKDAVLTFDAREIPGENQIAVIREKLELRGD